MTEVTDIITPGNGGAFTVETYDSKGISHLAAESIDDFSETHLGRSPYPFREEDEVRVLFYIRAEKIVALGGSSPQVFPFQKSHFKQLRQTR